MQVSEYEKKFSSPYLLRFYEQRKYVNKGEKMTDSQVYNKTGLFNPR